MGLTRAQMRAAIGLCATRATGLRCQFGTMGKPYNAGVAAAAGVECAQLAKAGMTAPDDGLFGQNGYLATHSDAPGDITPVQDVWLLDDMKYKLHACCHGTHAMIEALKGHDIKGITALRLRTNPRWLTVCDLKAYTDALANDPALATFTQCVEVTGDSTLTDMQVAGEVQMRDGSTQGFVHDLAAPIPVGDLTLSLRSKAHALLGRSSDALCDALASLDGKTARDLAALMEQRA
jgi:hypothetical protein